MRLLFNVIGIIILLTSYVLSDDLTRAKQKDINLLLEMTGGTRIGEQFATDIITQMKRTLIEKKASVPDSVINIVETTITDILNELINQKGGLKDNLQKIYHKYFSHNEIKDLKKFYKTDIGQKTINVIPMLSNEIVIVSQEWQQNSTVVIIEKLVSRLKEKGINL